MWCPNPDLLRMESFIADISIANKSSSFLNTFLCSNIKPRILHELSHLTLPKIPIIGVKVLGNLGGSLT